jgi:hypothetical protein
MKKGECLIEYGGKGSSNQQYWKDKISKKVAEIKALRSENENLRSENKFLTKEAYGK